VIDRLAGDPTRLDQMGELAQRFAREELAPARTAAVYLDAIADVLALEADPSRTALARWAGALREMGVAPHHVERGFGIAYADALDQMRSQR
jgi:hypothetical protein